MIVTKLNQVRTGPPGPLASLYGVNKSPQRGDTQLKEIQEIQTMTTPVSSYTLPASTITQLIAAHPDIDSWDTSLGRLSKSD